MTTRARGVGHHRVGDDVGIGQIDRGVDHDVAVEVVVAQQRGRQQVGAAAVEVGPGRADPVRQRAGGEHPGHRPAVGVALDLPGRGGPGVGRAPGVGHDLVGHRVVGGDDLGVRPAGGDDVLDQAERLIPQRAVELGRGLAGERADGWQADRRQLEPEQEGLGVQVAHRRGELRSGQVAVDEPGQRRWIGGDRVELGQRRPHPAQRHRRAGEVVDRAEQGQGRGRRRAGVGWRIDRRAVVAAAAQGPRADQAGGQQHQQ